jgi:hypothetical protein
VSFTRRLGWHGLVVALTCVALGHAPRVDAGEATREHAPVANAEVRVTVIGTLDQVNRIRSAVAEWRLGDRRVHWDTAAEFDKRAWFTSDADEAVVHCWVDLAEGRSVRLYFANEFTQRYLLRTLETSGELDEMDRAALGQAIELSLLAMLEDRDAGVSRAQAESLVEPTARAETPPVPADPIVDPPDPLPPSHGGDSGDDAPRPWELGIGYQGGYWLAEAPLAHGPRLHVAYAFLAEPRLSLSASGQHRLRATWHAELVSLAAESTALTLGAEVAPRLFGFASGASERLAVRVALGLELAGIEPSVREPSPQAQSTSSRRFALPLGLVALESLTELPYGIAIRGGGFVELLPVSPRYEVGVAGRRETALTTARVRPGVALSVGLFID